MLAAASVARSRWCAPPPTWAPWSSTSRSGVSRTQPLLVHAAAGCPPTWSCWPATRAIPGPTPTCSRRSRRLSAARAGATGAPRARGHRLRSAPGSCIASDADDEVRAAVRAVIDAVRRGTSLDRIAILHASPEPYARLAHEHLAAAGIATNGPAVVPLAGRVAGRALLELLALPGRGFRRQDVFSWLTTRADAACRAHGRPWWRGNGCRAMPGVVAGRVDWDDAPRSLRRRARQRAPPSATPTPQQPAWKAERDDEHGRAGRVTCASSSSTSIDDLDPAASATAPVDASTPRGPGAICAGCSAAPVAATRGRRPRPSGRAGRAALDRLAALDPVEGAGRPRRVHPHPRPRTRGRPRTGRSLR